jgi:hypothetical protein
MTEQKPNKNESWLEREVELQEFAKFEVNEELIQTGHSNYSEEGITLIKSYFNFIVEKIYVKAKEFREERDAPYYIAGLRGSFWYGAGFFVRSQRYDLHYDKDVGKCAQIYGDYLYRHFNGEEAIHFDGKVGRNTKTWQEYIEWLRYKSSTFENKSESRPDSYHAISDFVEICLEADKKYADELAKIGIKKIEDDRKVISLFEINPLLREAQFFDDGCFQIRPSDKKSR